MAEANCTNSEDQHEMIKRIFSQSNCELSFLNGMINQMKESDIRIQLALVDLDERGVKKVLIRRLKNYYKKIKNPKAQPQNLSHHDYYCIIDFEGTCEECNPADYVHEIIEFPAVLVNGKTLELEDEFHEYCRPVEKTVLSEFCQNLTGITQATVDAAQPFPVVLSNFNQWLKKHNLGTDHTFAIVTDGPWDLGKFLSEQCTLSGIPLPSYANQWINLRKHCYRYYNFHKDSPVTLGELLESLGLSFEGRPHSGIDDARNISKMLVKMMNDGLEARINDDLAKQKRLRTI